VTELPIPRQHHQKQPEQRRLARTVRGYDLRSLIGQQLGDYVLEAELGSGSMGAVYRATYLPHRTPVAVKVLLEELAGDVSFITRFIREARVVSQLDHPNIVRVYDAGRHAEHIYFVMEYFPGATAGQMLRERKRLPLETVVDIATQTADALAYAHRQGRLVHRDIKPDNLLVDDRCRVKVLDFGLARIEGARSITVAGTVVGSLYYVAPEQLLGRTLDGRADVYALGITMYEMLTGQRPYRGQSLTEMSDAILSGTATPPSRLVNAVPSEVEHIIARAMARDLDHRYHDAGELFHDLRTFQQQMTHIATARVPVPTMPQAPQAPHQPPLPHLSHLPYAPPPATGRPGYGEQEHAPNRLRTSPPAVEAPYPTPPRRPRDER
jgi:serine/threonine-protein kinase